MTVITYRELQRISARKLVGMLPIVITVEGEERFKVEEIVKEENTLLSPVLLSSETPSEP